MCFTRTTHSFVLLFSFSLYLCAKIFVFMTTPGIDLSHSAEAAAKVFLHTVGILASAQKFTVFSLAECLGLTFVTPLMRPPSGNKAIVDSDVALQHARFLYEPKFR